MKSKMRIRKANIKDLKAIFKLVSSSENLAGDKNDVYETYTIKQYIQGPIVKTFVVEIEKHIIGVIFIEIWKKAKYSYIPDIVIDKKFRGKCIGYKLMNYAENYAKEEGVKYLFSYVEENNKIAQKMNIKLKYKPGNKFIYYSKELK